MNNAPAKMLVFTAGSMACIKIAGRATFTSSPDFERLIKELSRRDVKRFVLDLTDCNYMDSTILGTLAGFGLAVKRNPQNGQTVELMNLDPRVSAAIEQVGAMPLFTVITCENVLPADGVAVTLPEARPSRAEITSQCLKAHQTLMEVDPANIPKFKEVTQFLNEDLKKMKNGA